MRDEYYQKDRAYRDYASENRRRMVAQHVLEDKEREQEEAELEKKEQEELLKRPPFEKQMAECDTVLSYLKGLLPKEKKAAKQEAEIKVPEGMVLVKKVEEDYFSVAGAKKSKKERKASKKSGLVHNLASLESFAAIRITAPKTLEDVQTCIEQVEARKKFFDTLPRGSDIDAELAKLN